MTEAMERSLSSDPIPARRNDYYQRDTDPRPPWEHRYTAQVPYIRPTSPPLTQAERQALWSLSATEEISGLDHPDHNDRRRHGSAPSNNTQDSHGCSVSRAVDSAALGQYSTPRTAPVFAVKPMHSSPYGSPRIPPGPKSAPPAPSSTKGPTSPETLNFSRSSSKSSSGKSAYFESPREVPLTCKTSSAALPGTMSTRENAIPRSRSRHDAAGASQDRSKKEKSESARFKRFKLAVKDIFKREPVDETEFERIEDRHWTDE